MFEFAMKTKTAVLRVLVLAGVGLGMAAGAGATSVTFRFEAKVYSIANTIPFDSGLEVQVGDTVAGMFTFEPMVSMDQPSLEVVQPYTATILVDEALFTTEVKSSFFTLQSFNNSGITDFPPTTVIDTIDAFGALGPADPELFPSLAMSTASFHITLWGEPSVLDAASFPSEPAVWNSPQLTFRRSLSVNIRGASGGSR